MGKSTSFAGGAMIMLLLFAGQGCAVYRKCGFHGCPGDAEVTAAVWRLFQQRPALLAPNQVDVQTWDRVVYLHGVVNTEMERQLAESVAAEAPGAARVVNLLGVSNGSR